MDESWRMRMGMPSTAQVNDSRRRSTEYCRRMISGDPPSLLLQPQDFDDVFGGPPQIVIARQLSSGTNNDAFPRPSLYQTIFQAAEDVGPEFKAPTSKRSDEGFYSDIFGWDEEDEVRRMRSRSGSKSKASSTSALSSEDLSPLQPKPPYPNDHVSFFASTLRPINIPSRWSSTKMVHEENDRQHDKMEAAGEFPWSYLGANQPHVRLKSCNNSGYCPGNSSPETIGLEPDYLFGSMKVGGSDEYLDSISPFSAVSSICQEEQEAGPACKTHDEMFVEEHDVEHVDEDDDDDDDEVMNSYVIEINSDYRERTDDAIGVDEAIAWAKEKFQKQYPEGESEIKEQSADAVEELANRDHPIPDRQKIDTHRSSDTSLQMEMEVLDESVKLWSTGKENDIRLLLSNLHHILWPNSGWVPVLMTTLIESSHVKKAYQKARLCLHPDKLQQRGATLPQKYISEKVFSILQEAWAAFISQR